MNMDECHKKTNDYNIIKKLRAPNGCEWDKKQTHESLIPYLIEETYSSQRVSLVTIGKKGSEILSKTGKVKSSYDSIFDELTYNNVGLIAQELMSKY